MQLGANHLSTFSTNRNDNRASYLQATLSVGRMGLGKIGHGCGLCHRALTSSRLPKGVADRMAFVN